VITHKLATLYGSGYLPLTLPVPPQCRVDYKQCHLAHRQNPSQHSLTEYIDAHNAYVQQLHATNGMLEAYHSDTLPQQMQELEEIHNDLVAIVSDSLMQGAEVIAGKVSVRGAVIYHCSRWLSHPGKSPLYIAW